MLIDASETIRLGTAEQLFVLRILRFESHVQTAKVTLAGWCVSGSSTTQSPNAATSDPSPTPVRYGWPQPVYILANLWFPNIRELYLTCPSEASNTVEISRAFRAPSSRTTLAVLPLATFKIETLPWDDSARGGFLRIAPALLSQRSRLTAQAPLALPLEAISLANWHRVQANEVSSSHTWH